MSSKTEKDKVKQIQDKCQAVLNEMLRDEDNKYCVDCDSKGPRWASWNLGVFLCIRCAGIHRNLGVHISKVKSVNLDSWTPEQVVSLQQMGNSRARAVYEANIPDNFRRPQNDSSLESFVRAKYEHKKYIAREWVPPVIPKVDWEKEIDEEIERQKRKKKAQAAAASSATIDKKPIKIAEVPQIPKPKNASPKPNRTSSTITTSTEKTTQDLLGLQNGEDGFTGFLSGPTPQTNKTVKEGKKEEVPPQVSAEAAAKAEEESFFNQPAPTEKEKTKLTKDSILALYGSAPSTQPPVMFNVPQCTTFPQQGFPAAQPFGATFPSSQPTAQPGFPQQTTTAQTAAAVFPQMQNGFQTGQFQQFATPAGQFVAPQMAPNQFMPTQPSFAPVIQGQFPGMVPQYPATGQLPPQQFAPFQQQSSVFASSATVVPNPTAVAAAAAATVSNPFFGNPQQPGALQQQFAGMSIGGPMASAKPPGAATVAATNLWQ